MNLFKSFTLTWWQVGLFKLGMLAAGLLIGAYFRDAVLAAWPVVAVLAIVALGYVSYLWFRQPGLSPTG